MRGKAQIIILLVFLFTSCNDKINDDSQQHSNWKEELKIEFPKLGHRNWILVVDKAFPDFAAEDIKTIETKEPLINVINEVKAQLDSQTHVKPIIYKDLELDYLNKDILNGIDEFKDDLYKIYPKDSFSTILHDKVLSKIDSASNIFTVLVLKTETTIPYSSVFIELDCKYWNLELETQLRENMKKFVDAE